MANAENHKLHIADLAECIDAIKALSDQEVGRLKSYAKSKTFTSPGVLYNADAEDLFHEAIARTLDGRRQWKPQQITFALHLRGCIRSIAYEYAEEAERRSDALAEQVPREEERIYRAAIFNQARLLLKSDRLAAAVLNLLLDGHLPRAVRTLLDIEENVYNAARKRIFRCLHRVVS